MGAAVQHTLDGSAAVENADESKMCAVIALLQVQRSITSFLQAWTPRQLASLRRPIYLDIVLAMASMRQSMLLQPHRLARTAAWHLQAGRTLSSSAGRLSANGKNDPDATPAPPKGVDSSTSALDYKLQHPRPRPPSLPEIDPPKWSAEYAVTNIL